LNKKKIINDPVYGFVTLPDELTYDIISHPFFQRLRRIKQLGLTEYVYPGALHTRFHHALGAMHLMQQALEVLINKGHQISTQEKQAACLAILLHDIGHGPFSHALETAILKGVHHENLTILLIKHLNKVFDGKLTKALAVFENTYEKKFLHQLVSSQLDMDRLDYIQRDAYYTGVSEGAIGADRIIRMLNIFQDKIVIEKKGLYSIENFLNVRRLMYWQVYLHKTTLSTEHLLIKTIKRAKYLFQQNKAPQTHPNFSPFLAHDFALQDFEQKPELLEMFAQIDDYDVWASIKIWAKDQDKVLAALSNMLLNRNLFVAQISDTPFEQAKIDLILERIAAHFQISPDDATFFLANGQVSNEAYRSKTEQIFVLTAPDQIKEITAATDLAAVRAMTKIVVKHYLCYPKNISLPSL